MATLADLKRRVLNLISDIEVAGSNPVAGAQFSATLLLEAVNAGLDAILPWVSKSGVATLTGDGVLTEFSLPTDLYRIEAVWDGLYKNFVPIVKMSPDMQWSDILMDLCCMDYPEGKITFSYALSTSGGKLYYAATWTKPEVDDDDILSPEVTHTAICLFAASYCMLNTATQAAILNAFKQKVDSGTPEDNPAKTMSDYFLRRFEVEMNRHPAKDRGQR